MPDGPAEEAGAWTATGSLRRGSISIRAISGRSPRYAGLKPVEFVGPVIFFASGPGGG